jgi:hypothetical protein
MYKAQFVLGLVLVATLLFMSACGASEETPVEEAEEEAGPEEVEPEPADIQAEGCSEGQVSNEAGTECYPQEQAERAREQT